MNRNHVFKNISIEKNKHKKNKRRCSVVVKFTSINIKSNGKVNAIIQNRNLNWNPMGPNMLERTAETICIIKCEAIYLRFGTQKRRNCWVYWKIDRTWQYIYLSSIFFWCCQQTYSVYCSIQQLKFFSEENYQLSILT